MTHGDGRGATYYDRPAIKEPVWTWEVPLYFYIGGAAGAAAALAAAAQTGGDDMRGLVAKGRWIAALGGAAGTMLLIADLGRPERFLNMLRVFKSSSPLNVGSWILSATTAQAGCSVILRDAGGAARTLGDLAGLGSGVTGLPLSGYTAVLLADTAVPLWSATRRSLPFLFAASAAGSAASLVALTTLNERELRAVKLFGAAGQVAELAASSWVQREAGRVAGVGRPLHQGPSGSLWRASKALTATSLALSLLVKSRLAMVVSGALGSLGGIALRYAVFEAGKASARDPRATFDMQRAVENES